MTFRQHLLLCAGMLLAGRPSAQAGDEVVFLGVQAQARPETAPALVSGQAATLRFLLPPDASLSNLVPRLSQTGGALARPIETEITLSADPADPRITLVRFTAPPIKRVARLVLRLGASVPPFTFLVFPAEMRRDDLAPLDDALAASRLRLVVCGRSPELRAYLSEQNLDFDDLGPDAPDRLPAGSLLIGPLDAEDWRRLAPPRPDAAPGGRLLAFVDEPALLPGVYAQTSASSPAGSAPHAVKVTLPLLPLLPQDPRARQTLHTLLLETLVPAQP